MEIKHAHFNGREFTASFTDGVAVQAGGEFPKYSKTGEFEFWGITVSSPERSGERFAPHDCAGGVERDPKQFQEHIDAAIAAWQMC